MFTSEETRKEILHALVLPSMDWGPALPEDRRKYSSSSDRKPHASGDTLGDDEVFDGAELVDFKPRPDENNRLVHFEDETREEDKAEGGAEGQKVEGEDKDEKKEDEDKLLNSDQKA